MKHIYILGVGVLILSFLWSCNVDEINPKDIYLDDVKPKLATELGVINYTMSELLRELDSEDFEIDSSDADLIKLVFSDSTFITKGDLLEDAEFGDFEDVVVTKSLTPFKNLPVAIDNTSPVTITRTFSESEQIVDTLEYEYEQEAGTQNLIDQIFYSGGFLSISTSTASGSIFNYTLQALNTLNTLTDAPIAFDGTTGDVAQEKGLSGFNTDFSGSDGKAISKFLLTVVSAELPPGARISSVTTVDIEVRTRNIDINTIAAIYGGFESDTIDVAGDSITFDGLEDFEPGGLKFNQASISIGVVNYIGVPLTVDLSKIVADTKVAKNVSLGIAASEGEIEPVGVSSPRIYDYDLITPANDVIKIDNTTSDIVNVIADIPTGFRFPISAIINPDNQTSDQFVVLPTKDSDTVLSLITKVELPLDISFANVEYPIELDGLGLGDEINEADSAHIKIISNNGLPLTVGASVGFLDENGAEFAPRTENTVLIKGNASAESILGLKKTEIDALLKADKLKVFLSIGSSDNATIGAKDAISMTVSAYLNPTIDL